MNLPEGEVKFVPKQAIAPTPALYDELVGDCMFQLAKVSLGCIDPLKSGSVIHDVGCGTGAGTEAIVSSIGGQDVNISIKGTDILEDAVATYTKRASDLEWPAEGIKADCHALPFEDGTFTHTLGNAFIFVLPNNGVDAVKEVHRTLAPGGTAIFNSFNYIATLGPLEEASRQTRPEGTPLPRRAMRQWEDPEFLKKAVEDGGFKDIKLGKAEGLITTVEADRYVNMLWSFVGGTTPVGWLKSDEERWDEAIDILKKEFKKTEGFRKLEDGRYQIRFKANIAIATK
ncbi:methyltransferase domain-containing protein [Sarocladium implicatum]|nr:methyltransferase domain-containing protein [Sarocladium implicatum]